MRARHIATLGICVGSATGGALFAGCGTNTFGTCSDTNTCTQGDGGADGTSPGDGSIGNDAPMKVDGSSDGAEGSTTEGGPTEAGCSAPTSLDCNGTCVDPTLPAHCGSCNNACGGPDAGAGQATCTGGTCTVGCDADSSTPLNCSGACVDPTQPANCGACGYTCTPPTQGVALCSLDGGGTPIDAGGDGGPCGFTCNSGYHACGLTCMANTDDPSSDPCVVSNSTGVFVAPTGSDSTGTGTEAAPYATFSKAISVATSGAMLKRVYACLGTYSEQLSVSALADGVRIYGGLDCTNGWAYVGTPATGATVIQTPSNVAAPATALTVSGTMSTGVVFQDVGFTSNNGVNPGDSSVAVLVSSGAILSLTRGVVTAGSGVLGAPGGTNSNWSGPAPGGNQPLGLGSGGLPGQNTCNDSSTSSGGTGGGCTGVTCNGGDPGSTSSIASPPLNGGSGGDQSCSPGTVGVNGPASTTTGAGATSSGSITASGWSLGASGGAGGIGGAAQGGGGGGGLDKATAGPGSGGGAGGCGGAAGTGGGGGGSSIGILDYDATLSLQGNVTVVTASAGGGGTGGPGQPGQAGATGATGANANSCGGGPGGNGAGGSGGGGGAGGNAVGIAWHGTGPTVNGTLVSTTQASPYMNITAGSKGAVGPGGSGCEGSPSSTGCPSGNPGAAGSSNAIEAF